MRIEDNDRRQPLPMWVVYDRPKDHPTKVIVRKWLIPAPPESGPVPTREGFYTDTVDEAVTLLERAGRSPLGRNAGDSPDIIGTWV